MAILRAILVPRLAGILRSGQITRFERELERRDRGFGFAVCAGVDAVWQVCRVVAQSVGNRRLCRGSHESSGVMQKVGPGQRAAKERQYTCVQSRKLHAASESVGFCANREQPPHLWEQGLPAKNVHAVNQTECYLPGNLNPIQHPIHRQLRQHDDLLNRHQRMPLRPLQTRRKITAHHTR